MEKCIIQDQDKKRGRGRPRKEEPVMTTNIRLEVDLYDWIKATKGAKSINQYINDLIRAEAGL